jgi:hypothetical protein
LKKLKIKIGSYALDDAYNSFNSYADICNYFKSSHVIYPPYDAAISEEGKVEHYM